MAKVSDGPRATVLRALILARAGRRAEALALARGLANGDGLGGIDFSAVWAALGDADKAFALLDKECAEKKLTPDVRIDPDYDSLRADPRFVKVLDCANRE